MNKQMKLDFFQKILKDLHITSCVVTDPSRNIPTEIDLGLRKTLFALDNYANFFDNSMNQAKDYTLYCFFDEYDCHYIFLKLPDKTKESYFYIGPYLLDIPPKERVARKAEAMNMTDEQTKELYLYYSNLPIMENENLILTMANTLAKEIWENHPHVMHYVDYAIHDHHNPVPVSRTPASGTNTITLSSLEKSYGNENHLMDAVSKGKLHLITTVASSVFNNGTEPLLNDSLRERKNNLIILKTLLRKAAEYGGVHPLHIHKLSNQFTEQIEGIRTIKESLRLQEDMIRSYCLLVKKHSLTSYSFYVGQAITLVQYDLAADLSLKVIAAKLNVNASYLSALFHKEYGCTLTDFINKQRIDYSLTLLQTTRKTVQEIAAECGIHDTTYFIKLFKKQVGITPNQYKKDFMIDISL